MGMERAIHVPYARTPKKQPELYTSRTAIVVPIKIIFDISTRLCARP